ncbi:MAG: hypothetical protein R2748_02630 [Bryobacterales bacterium]
MVWIGAAPVDLGAVAEAERDEQDAVGGRRRILERGLRGGLRREQSGEDEERAARRFTGSSIPGLPSGRGYKRSLIYS